MAPILVPLLPLEASMQKEAITINQSSSHKLSKSNKTGLRSFRILSMHFKTPNKKTSLRQLLSFSNLKRRSCSTISLKNRIQSAVVSQWKITHRVL
jgi:hypothetical protein